MCRAELSDMVGLQPALPHMGRTGYDLAEKARAQRLSHLHQPPPAQSLDRAAEQSPIAGHQGGLNSPGPVGEGTEEPHIELSRFSMAASVESCDVYGAPAPMLISRYERNPPPEMVEGKPGQLPICTTTRTLHIPVLYTLSCALHSVKPLPCNAVPACTGFGLLFVQLCMVRIGARKGKTEWCYITTNPVCPVQPYTQRFFEIRHGIDVRVHVQLVRLSTSGGGQTTCRPRVKGLASWGSPRSGSARSSTP